jgi:hypothetical protein
MPSAVRSRAPKSFRDTLSLCHSEAAAEEPMHSFPSEGFMFAQPLSSCILTGGRPTQGGRTEWKDPEDIS